MDNVAQILIENPGYKKKMRTEWLEPEGSFHCFAHDDRYLAEVGLKHHGHGQAGVATQQSAATARTESKSRTTPAME